MSHPGNWRRNPRKMAMEIERAREMDEAILTPLSTRKLGWREHEIGCGCPLHRPIPGGRLHVPRRFLNDPWIVIMARHLVCSACGQRPYYLSFATRDAMGMIWACQATIKLR